jgi:hypothetical protein
MSVSVLVCAWAGEGTVLGLQWLIREIGIMVGRTVVLLELRIEGQVWSGMLVTTKKRMGSY